MSMTEQVVMKMMLGFENKGHVLYMDNFYSSPSLFAELKQNGIGAVGTVRHNRKHMPRDIGPRMLHLEKGDSPVFRKTSDSHMVTAVMMDTKRVQFLSTVDNDLTIDKNVRKKGAEGGYRTVEKPVMGEDYNAHMNAVDICDQKLGTYAYPHKSTKWYMTLYHRIREVALVNSYIVYQQSLKDGEKLLPPRTFREAVIDGLLEGWDVSETNKKGRPSLSDKPGRMTERHFPGLYDDKKHRPDCIVCSDRNSRGWKRVQTKFYCVDCNLPMCPTVCFKLYHTCMDFKTAAARQIHGLQS